MDTISVRTCLLQRMKEIPNGIRLSNDLDRQPHSERTLNPQNQLGTAEAVNAEIPLKLTGR